MKWSFFAGSVILAGWILLSYGAPPLAIAAGIVLAAVVTLRQSHRQKI